MSDAECLQRLVTSADYHALRQLKPEFSFFALLGDVLREPAWSRIFASVLDSTYPHGLGDRGLREWLDRVIAEQRRHGGTAPHFFAELPKSLVCRTSVEYQTPAGRRIDILVRLHDQQHRIVGVIGIENKLNAPEALAQIADYQEALAEVFPSAQKLIVYLTPDGRQARTAIAKADCPCCPATYRTMIGACAALAPHAEPRVALLLDSLRLEIETVVLGADRMKADAKALVKQLWADSEHRRAIRLLVECVPTPRHLWETELLPHVKSLALPGLSLDEVSYYPKGASSPREILFPCRVEVGEQADRFGVAYMLRCEDQTPDIGSEFTLRLVAWCDSAEVRKRVQRLWRGRMPPLVGVQKTWSRWEPIWTGGSYPLQDLTVRDAVGLADLLRNGVEQTHSVLTTAGDGASSVGGTTSTSKKTR